MQIPLLEATQRRCALRWLPREPRLQKRLQYSMLLLIKRR